MNLKEWARRENRKLHRQALEDRDSKLWHSHAYHRYFEGYREYQELDRNGKPHIRRVYMGPTWTQKLSGKAYWGVRIAYLVLFLLSCACVFLASRGQGRAGTAFYLAIPELATLGLLAWAGYILLLNYLILPRKMTVHDYYASTVALKRASFCLSIAFGVDLVMTLLDLILAGPGRYTSVPLVLLSFAVGCLACVAMHRTEKRIPYEETPPKEAPGENAGVFIEGEHTEQAG